MRRNRHRLTQMWAARDFTLRAVRAWRRLLPDWTPTLEQLRGLENMPSEHRYAVRIVSEGWADTDVRWDVLMALLEYERREERRRHVVTVSDEEWDEYNAPDNVVSMDEDFERLRYDSEITTETPLPERCNWCDESDDEYCFLHKPEEERPPLVLVPKDPPRVFTVRTLKSIREEQMRDE